MTDITFRVSSGADELRDAAEALEDLLASPVVERDDYLCGPLVNLLMAMDEAIVDALRAQPAP